MQKNRIAKCFDKAENGEPMTLGPGQEVKFESETQPDGIPDAPEVYENPFRPPMLTKEDWQEIYREEDKAEINNVVDQIRHFARRLDSHAFNPAMTKQLRELIVILMEHKRDLVAEYYKKYGKPKVI